MQSAATLSEFWLCSSLSKVNIRIRWVVNRFAATSAVAELALNGVLYAVDGVGLKQAVDA